MTPGDEPVASWLDFARLLSDVSRRLGAALRSYDDALELAEALQAADMALAVKDQRARVDHARVMLRGVQRDAVAEWQAKAKPYLRHQ